MENPESGASRCEERLAELTDADIEDFRDYTERRLLRIGLAADLARDVVQASLQSVLQGLDLSGVGRRPRPEDVESRQAFKIYLHGVANSKIEALGRCRDFKVKQVSITESTAEENNSTVGGVDSGVVLTAPEMSPDEQAGWEDYRTALFARLRERAPQRLLNDIDKWEQEFASSESIPARGRHYIDIKALAREVVAELGGID